MFNAIVFLRLKTALKARFDHQYFHRSDEKIPRNDENESVIANRSEGVCGGVKPAYRQKGNLILQRARFEI